MAKFKLDPRKTDQLFRSFNAYFRPPSRMPLSDWADRYRILSPESSAEPGRWITAKAPYEKAIMDAISDPEIPKVVIQKASQVGITDCAILNPIGYFLDQEPCPILVVQPTIELAEAFSTDRLAPMLRHSPRLRGKVADPRTKDSSNTLRKKSFKGGYIALGGANSAASLSGRPVRVVLLDEVDRYPPSAGTEGNPLQLAIARTSAFWNRKAVVASSPGIKGASHIEREMEESTKEHWYLPCPSCGCYQVLDWTRIRFSDAQHRCIECEAYAPKYRWLAGRGEWRAHRPLDGNGNKIRARGFYVSGLVNPWIAWEILIDEFRRANAAKDEGDIEPMKAFRNTRLGLAFEDVGMRVETDLFKHRREVYEGEIPDGVLVLTAGVDVGDRMLNFEVVGWGRGRESWAIEYGILDGDPREPDVWDLLDRAVFNRVFEARNGKRMRVRRMAVDAGFASDFVYAYTKPRQPRAIAVRGVGGIGKAFIAGQTTTKTNRARLVLLGVDSGKEEIVHRLRVDKPGPGYCHFPKLLNGEPDRGYDKEYFRGLTAEQRITKSKHGFPTYFWAKRPSQRNEPFDVRNYSLAALCLPFSGIDLASMDRDTYTPPDQTESKQSPFGSRQMQVSPQQPTQQQAKAIFGAVNRPLR